MDLKKKLKKLIKRKKRMPRKKTVEIAGTGVQVPRQWLKQEKGKSKPSKGYVIVERIKQPHTIHIPGFRNIKRAFALILAVVWFVFSQTAFASPLQFMGVIFLLTCYLLLDYVWQTRKSAPVFKEEKKLEEKTAS